MNNKLYKEALQREVASKFGDKSSVASRFKPLYPDSAEREFRRVTNAYMGCLKKIFTKHLPVIKDIYKKTQKRNSQIGKRMEFNIAMRNEFQKMSVELSKALYRYHLENKVNRIASSVQVTSYLEWKKLCQSTLGVTLLDDYYSKDFYEHVLRSWVDGNVLKIQTIPSYALNDMQNVILEGFKDGLHVKALTKQLQETYRLSKRKAELLARDQTASLNSQITRLQHADAGITKYRWSTSKDARVRDCHKALDGRVFEWDRPPQMWYMTKSRGRVYTGRYCAPGEDYTCRCVAIPVFDINTLNIPIQQQEDKDKNAG